MSQQPEFSEPAYFQGEVYPRVADNYGPLSYPEPPRPSWRWVIGLILGVLALIIVGFVVIVTLQDKSDRPSHSQQIIDWRDGAKGPFTQVGTDLILISDAIDGQDILAVRSACAVLATDVAEAKDALPTPDEALTSAMSSMLDDYYKAALTCQDLSTSADATVTATFLKSGNEQLDKAAAIIKKAEEDVKAEQE